MHTAKSLQYSRKLKLLADEKGPQLRDLGSCLIIHLNLYIYSRTNDVIMKEELTMSVISIGAPLSSLTTCLENYFLSKYIV